MKRDVRSGTGPRVRVVDGMTASVTDIISRTDAMDPRVRAARPEIAKLEPSSVKRWLRFGRAL